MLESPSSQLRAFEWAFLPQRAVGVVCVVLIAAALQAGAARRKAALLAVAAGILPLANAAVMIFAVAALALVGAARLVRLHGRERFVFAGALVASALLTVLAGGPISDALFDRGGTVGDIRAAWQPAADDLLPFQRVGPALVEVGVIPLVAIGALAAYRRRSWGLGFLAAAGACGLLQMELLQSRTPFNDLRIIWLSQAVALLAALAGAGVLLGGLRGSGRRSLAALAVGILVILPTALPRAVSGVHLALRELQHADPLADASGHHYLDRTTLSKKLAANWEFYDWLRQSLPHDARILTKDLDRITSAAGVAAPFSGGDFQIFNSGTTSWLYADAMRFLHRDDLTTLGITHLHATAASVSNLDPSAASLLDHPRHFRLLAEISTSSGARHRVYEVMPGAGTTATAPTSYRALRQLVAPQATVSVLGSLDDFQRWAILSAFAGQAELQSSIRIGFTRGTLTPPITVLAGLPQRGVVLLAEPLEPTALGVSRDEALWTGHGMRAYDLAAEWSPVWSHWARPLSRSPMPSRSICDTALNGQIDLRHRRARGRSRPAPTELTLTGLPQGSPFLDCVALTLSVGRHRPRRPLSQVRAPITTAHRRRTPRSPRSASTAVSTASAPSSIRLVPQSRRRDISFATGTELRLYEASPLGVSLPPATRTLVTASAVVARPDCPVRRQSKRTHRRSTPGGSKSTAMGAAVQPRPVLSPVIRRISLASTRALAWRFSTSCPWHAC